ncbi:hypothetical protein DFH29DRAFT_983462 [Suillus ampliporus]|nr:hypothetical protein DFH29DRAFT_983462 [Suillus ampliporus]
MSSSSQNNTDNAVLDTSRPQHQLHDTSQPLPGSGSRAAAQTQDYSPANIERMSSSVIHGKNASTESDDADSTRATRGTGPDSQQARGNTAFTTARLVFNLCKKVLTFCGVAVGGQPNLPEGHAGFGDKVIGKAQKVAGKYTKNEELHEKGELRETGGKAAALGNARAAHD